MDGTKAPGRLIFLHGASSSGKSTLAEAVLGRLDAPFWYLSIDRFRDAGIWRMRDFGPRFDWSAHRTRYFEGFHGSVAAALLAGNDVLLEHILDTPGWHGGLVRRLSGVDVFFVALHTPPEVLSSREAARGDRPAGSAVRDFRSIHKGLRYDLDLDGTKPAEENAATLLAAWRARRGLSSFFQEQ